MSDIFSNFEPAEEVKEVARDYDNIKPFYASPHGHSRLFTATHNGKKVVLKTLKESFANDLQCREALKNEFEITSQLDHKFIRKAFGYENIQGLGDCVVFEYVNGKSLAEHIRVGTLNEKQIKSLLVDLCDALSYMHQRGVCHCDLKPENIIVTAEDCRVKIIDIGLPETDYKTDHELLIKENEFIAPELFKGEEADPRSDIYSLGKIIEFIIERNMLNQYSSVATHCTQFSREQRFDNIQEVKSLLTKGASAVKIVILLLVIIAIGVAAFIYVPKIIEKSKVEKEQRLAVEFANEKESIKAGTAALCKKNRLVSLDERPEVLPATWKEDSISLDRQLRRFMVVESLRQEAEQVMVGQREAVIQNRWHVYDSLVKLQTIDTTAVKQ